ncbi:hypothetical protein J6590_009701 [Homalodisca vitripennis]|nr:hypothetical protein J6590_009701 [Homalodisca vitripennis]
MCNYSTYTECRTVEHVYPISKPLSHRQRRADIRFESLELCPAGTSIAPHNNLEKYVWKIVKHLPAPPGSSTALPYNLECLLPNLLAPLQLLHSSSEKLLHTTLKNMVLPKARGT